MKNLKRTFEEYNILHAKLERPENCFRKTFIYFFGSLLVSRLLIRIKVKIYVYSKGIWM